MVLILEGWSDIRAHVREQSLLFYLLKPFDRSRAITNRIFFFSEKTYFLICARKISTMRTKGLNSVLSTGFAFVHTVGPKKIFIAWKGISPCRLDYNTICPRSPILYSKLS